MDTKTDSLSLAERKRILILRVMSLSDRDVDWVCKLMIAMNTKSKRAVERLVNRWPGRSKRDRAALLRQAFVIMGIRKGKPQARTRRKEGVK